MTTVISDIKILNEDIARIYVLYHANCFDGTGAKYAAWRYFAEDATYIPVQYGKPFPFEVIIDKRSAVYILDFSYSRKELETLNDKLGLLKVIDHHKTAQEALTDLPYAQFDMEKSGAVMAWEYFHPREEVPSLLRYIQDGDLWQFKYPGTERIRAALPLLEGDMNAWHKCTYPVDMQALMAQGSTILQANQIKIDGVVKNNVKVVNYKGYRAGVYNTTVLTSEIGNAVYADQHLKCDLSMSYFFDKDGVPIVSFRSENPNGPDVGAMAAELGGGGHKHASGAKVTWEFIQGLYNSKAKE